MSVSTHGLTDLHKLSLHKMGMPRTIHGGDFSEFSVGRETIELERGAFSLFFLAPCQLTIVFDGDLVRPLSILLVLVQLIRPLIVLQRTTDGLCDEILLILINDGK